jgi:hypothetical protein
MKPPSDPIRVRQSRVTVRSTTALGIALALILLGASACVPRAIERDSSGRPNRKVNIRVDGAVIGPVDGNGQAWDGPGLSGRDIELFAALASRVVPVGQVPGVGVLAGKLAGELAKTTFAVFEAPDAKGVIELAVARASAPVRQSRALPVVQESYTPIWSATFAFVPIHKASLTITLWDADVMFDDPIGTVVIGTDDLLAAEAAGGPYAIDTIAASRGMIQRIFITVTPS